jgi:hypothetical protein
MSGLDLSGERKTMQAFAPWLQKGGWTIQDLTQPKTEKYNFPKILDEAKNLGTPEAALTLFRGVLYGYAEAIELPHDGEASRGKLTIWFDYKWKKTIKYGMGIEKEDYDKYLGYNKPWFYLFIYVEETKKRYIHQIKAGYPTDFYGGVEHYVIPQTDYWEPIEPKFPITLPSFQELSARESLAMLYALDDWACNGFAGEFEGITVADLQRADRALQNNSGLRGRLVFRKFRPNKLLEPEVYDPEIQRKL